MAGRARVVRWAALLAAGFAAGCHLTGPVAAPFDLPMPPPPDPPPGPVSPYHPRLPEPLRTPPEIRLLTPAGQSLSAELPPLVVPPPDRPRPEKPSPPLPPARPDPGVVVALRGMLDKKPAEALHAVQTYDKPTQDALLDLLPVALRLHEVGLEKAAPAEVAALLDHLRRFEDRLRPRAALVLEKHSYCRKIESFGDYDPLPPDTPFQAGRGGEPGERVQVYVQVRNLSPRVHGRSYETTIASRLEIYDRKGAIVARMDLERETDKSLWPRQDFFCHILFHVPSSITPGDYQLVVHVRDETVAGGGDARAASVRLPFRVQAPPR